MSLHEADIRGRFKRYLDRKAMPRRLEGRPGAIDDEVAALVRSIERNAPRGAERLAGWWPTFEAELAEHAGATWPTEKEVRDAARSATSKAPAPQLTDGPDMSAAAITGRRMAAGEPVGEGWLYGRLAVELIAGGHVDRETMEKYRSGAFLARRQIYKQSEALAWEAEAKSRHDAAREIHRESAHQREVKFAARTLAGALAARRSVPDDYARRANELAGEIFPDLAPEMREAAISEALKGDCMMGAAE